MQTNNTNQMSMTNLQQAVDFINGIDKNQTVYPDVILPPIFLPMQMGNQGLNMQAVQNMQAMQTVQCMQSMNMNVMPFPMVNVNMQPMPMMTPLFQSSSNEVMNAFSQDRSPCSDYLSPTNELVTISRSPSPVPEMNAHFKRTNSRESVHSNKSNKPRKFPHRSKQQKIEEIHKEVVEYYTEMGIFAGPEEVLRGEDTVRVHVKTFKGLTVIQKALRDVDNHIEVEVLRLAAPISMKNRFQKKGFIVYLKLGDVSQTSIVRNIFEGIYGEHFKKCDIALPKPEEVMTKSVVKDLMHNDLMKINPPAMMKKTSLGA